MRLRQNRQTDYNPPIDHTDREIDARVYQLYGLSDQEIALVESATRID